MRRSLERELSRALGFAIVAAGVAAAALAFGFGYEQAEDLQDDALRQIAALAAAAPGGPAALRADPGAMAEDRDAGILVVALSAPSRPAWLSGDLAPGFHTVRGETEPVRVYVRDARDGRIAVAQSTQLRKESALSSAAITLLPLLALLPLLVWLARRITRAELAPLRELARTVDAQLPERPQPLPAGDVPAEAASFVEAINRLLARVNELIAAQRRFVADAAHELRTPLAALAVQAGNLSQAQTAQDLQARIDALKTGIDRAAHLTEQLLDLARLQATGRDRQTVDVSRMARELIAQYLPLAEQRKVDIGMEEGGALTLSSDAASLRLIIKNALDNAVRHTPAGGHVTLRLAKEGATSIIEVIDTGPGIPADDLSRIFAPFYRGAGTAGTGSGLGLAIAKDAAERCGGSILLEARAGQPGTVFRYSQDG